MRYNPLVVFIVVTAACSLPTPGAQQAASAEQRPAASNATLFEGARLITGDGGAPIEDSAFLIESDHISRVGKA